MMHAKATLAPPPPPHPQPPPQPQPQPQPARTRTQPEPATRTKATLARDADGRLTAFLGSANLVRGSMNLPVWLRLLPFDELNVLVREPAFCARLDGAMDELFARAQPVEPAQRLVAASGWYSARSAWLDELWQ